MNKFLSLFISSIMLFNLTAEVFAAPIQFVTEKEEKDIRSAVGSAYNSGSASTADFATLERNYNNALKDLAEISDAYGNLEDAVFSAIGVEMMENGNWEILNNAILKQEKDLEKYNNVLQSYEDKINKLGGMENIEKQYALYQQWLDLKPEMDQRKAELENIIKTGEDKSAVKAAKQELDEYKKNYYSHENEFNKFKKDFDDISQDEEYLQGEVKRFEGLSELEEKTIQASQEAKQAILDLLPEDSGLSLDSDWDALFDAAQKESDKMIPELEKARAKFERAESAQDNAYQQYLENKFENEFSQTLIDYCEYVSKEAEKYQRPAEYGKVNGRDVAIEPGSVMRRADGTLVANVDETVQWIKIKDVYLACTNPSWDENKLKSWGSTVTMKELGDVKYGEYLLKYSFEEGKKLSDSEKKQMGQTLARKNLGMIIVYPERGIDYYYTLLGDYNQSKKLAEYFIDDWGKYGMRNTVWVENEFGDMEDAGTYELVPNTDEGEALKKTYVYRLLNYENTRGIIKQYFYEMNRLTIEMMNYLANNASNGARGIDGYLESIGISMTEDFLEIDDSIINKKFEEINRSFTQEEKEGIIETKITKRPFDPLMFALGPSHLIDRNRTLVRERRTAMAGFDLNMQGWRYLGQKKEPQPIMDLLVFNAHLQTSYRLYKPNLEAWNNLAFSAYQEEAMYFLAAMMSLGQQMHDKYEEMPTQYYEEIEESFHEEGKDIILDIGVGILMGGVASIANAAKTFISSTVKVVIKNSIKVALKSGFKQGVKAFGKRSLALTKVGLRKSVRNVSKALKGAFKPGDIKALTNAHRSTLNPSTKANVKAFREIKFKSPLRGTSHTLGREQGTVFTNTISKIKSQYGIRPAKTSKIFNTDLTKKEIAKLSADLDNFHAMQKAYKPVTPTKPVSTGVTVDATKLNQAQQAFNRSLSGARYQLFGQRGGVAAMSVVPIPPGGMDFLTGKATLGQLFNRNPLTTRIFNKSYKRTLKAIEREGLNPEQAKAFFLDDFSGRVNASPFMPKGRKQSLIDQVTSSLGVEGKSASPIENLIHVEKILGNPNKAVLYYTDDMGRVTAKEVPIKDFKEMTSNLSKAEKDAVKKRGDIFKEKIDKVRVDREYDRLSAMQKRVNEIDAELQNSANKMRNLQGKDLKAESRHARALQNEQQQLKFDVERGVKDLSKQTKTSEANVRKTINMTGELEPAAVPAKAPATREFADRSLMKDLQRPSNKPTDAGWDAREKLDMDNVVYAERHATDSNKAVLYYTDDMGRVSAKEVPMSEFREASSTLSEVERDAFKKRGNLFADKVDKVRVDREYDRLSSMKKRANEIDVELQNSANKMRNLKGKDFQAELRRSEALNAERKQLVADIDKGVKDLSKNIKTSEANVRKTINMTGELEPAAVPAKAPATREFADRSLMKDLQKTSGVKEMPISTSETIQKLLTEDPEISQAVKRNPFISRSFNKSMQNTIEAVEKEGLNPEEAKAFFMKDFSGRLEKSPFVFKSGREKATSAVSSAFEKEAKPRQLMDNLVYAERHATDPNKAVLYYTDDMGRVSAKEVPMAEFNEASSTLSEAEKDALKGRGASFADKVDKVRVEREYDRLSAMQKRANEIDVELQNSANKMRNLKGKDFQAELRRSEALQNEKQQLLADVDKGVKDLSKNIETSEASIRKTVNMTAEIKSPAAPAKAPATREFADRSLMKDLQRLSNKPTDAGWDAREKLDMDNLVYAERHATDPNKAVLYYTDDMGRVSAKEVPMAEFNEASSTLSEAERDAFKKRGDLFADKVDKVRVDREFDRLSSMKKRANEIDVELQNSANKMRNLKGQYFKAELSHNTALQNEQKQLLADVDKGVKDLSKHTKVSEKSIRKTIDMTTELEPAAAPAKAPATREFADRSLVKDVQRNTAKPTDTSWYAREQLDMDNLVYAERHATDPNKAVLYYSDDMGRVSAKEVPMSRFKKASSTLSEAERDAFKKRGDLFADKIDKVRVDREFDRLSSMKKRANEIDVELQNSANKMRNLKGQDFKAELSHNTALQNEQKQLLADVDKGVKDLSKHTKMSEKSVNDVLDLSPAKSSPAAAPAKPTVANFTKTQTPATAPARRVSPLQENSMDSNPFEKYENTSSKGGMNYDNYKYKPSATNPGVKSGLDGSVGGIQRRIMDMTSDAQSASKSAAKSSTEKTYTLGGDPKKVMVPVEDVSATPTNAQVTAKPKYLGATPNANGVTILIKTPSGKTFAENISQEGLAILSRGDTINLGYATLDKNTLSFLQNVAKVDPAIAKNLKAAKKPGFFENLFGKKGVAEPAVEKTYTLGGDPKKVMVPVKENVPAKPEYLAINPKANEVDILIKTPSGKKVSATLSREDLALLYRGETINLGEVTLDKDTLRFLQDIAKDDPIIAKNLQAAKKPGFFENLFGKKGVAEPAVEKTYTLGGDSKKVMIPAEENAPVKSNITGKVKDPAQAYKNAYNSGVVELNENELVRFNGNGGKAVNQDYIQASKDARKYMIDAVESGQYTASTDSYMQTMNEMHRVSANGKSGNLDWYKDAGQGKMSVNPGEIRTGGRPRNSRIEQAQKVEEIAKKYGDPFKVTGNSLVDLPGIPTNNLPANRYVDGQFFHYYPKGGETLRPYYRQMHRTAKEAVSLINQQASEREILEKLAEHYQYAANARPYGQINNSLFMNEVNTLLQKAGLRPIPHGELDIAAMHLQPNTFKKYFVDTYYKTKL